MAGRGDESVAQLLANLPPRVRQLRLASKSITAVGADAIAAALSTPTCGVRSVSLECNQLGNEGARALAAVTLGAAALTSLALGDNCIGADGVAALLDAVASGALLELDLGNSLLDGRRHNRFRADGTTTQALATCIASSQLTQLNLRGCGLDHRIYQKKNCLAIGGRPAARGHGHVARAGGPRAGAPAAHRTHCGKDRPVAHTVLLSLRRALPRCQPLCRAALRLAARESTPKGASAAAAARPCSPIMKRFALLVASTATGAALADSA